MVDEEKLRALWEAGGLKTIEIARELGTTLDGVRGIARRRGWVRGPVLRGKQVSPIDPAAESPNPPSARGKKPKPPKPPPERVDPEWSTLFSRLAEEHAKMDRLLAETRGIGRLQGA